MRDDDLPKTGDIIHSCLAQFDVFRLGVIGLGAFPDLKRPRVIFVKATDDPPSLEEMYRRLNDKLGRVGVRREKRPFRSHVTLGRVRQVGAVTLNLDKTTLERDFGSMEVSELTFMMSQLTPQGPVYTPVQKFSLA